MFTVETISQADFETYNSNHKSKDAHVGFGIMESRHIFC